MSITTSRHLRFDIERLKTNNIDKKMRSMRLFEIRFRYQIRCKFSGFFDWYWAGYWGFSMWYWTEWSSVFGFDGVFQYTDYETRFLGWIEYFSKCDQTGYIFWVTEVSILVSGMKIGRRYVSKLFCQGGFLKLCRDSSDYTRPPLILLILAAVSFLWCY